MKNNRKRKTLVIVGGGIAGHEAAFAARSADPDIRIVIITEEKHPLYSACVLADYVAGEILREKVFLRSPEDYKNAQIDFISTRRVTNISPDQQILQFEGEDLFYDFLILATGSKPAIPPITGIDLEGVFFFKTIENADQLKLHPAKSAIIVGSGPIGIELALALNKRGCAVTIIELLDRLLPRVFDPPLSCTLTRRLEDEGISIIHGEMVKEIFGEDHVQGIKTDHRTLRADLVAIVTGMKPAVELASKAGLKIGPSGGVLVDSFMATSSKNVWACGDCIESQDQITGERGLFMLWNNARLQGRVAGANAVGGSVSYPGSLNLTNLNLFNEVAASVGLQVDEIKDGEVRILHRKGHLGEFCLIFREDRIVGVQSVGETERVGGLLGVLHRGGKFYSALKDPSLTYGNQCWPLREVRREIIRLLETNSEMEQSDEFKK